MRLRNLLFIGVGIIAGFAAPALADLTYTQGSGTTIFDFVCFTTKHCSAHANVNSAGTEIMTTANPAMIDASTSSQIHSDLTAPVPTGTNLIGDVNVRQGGTALSATNPSFARLTDGTNAQISDPCQSATKAYTTINVATATNVIITGVAAKKKYICGIFLYPAGTDNIAIFQATTGTACVTALVGVIGGTTTATGIIATAQAGFVLGNGASSVAATTVNQTDLCIVTSAVVQLSGVVVTVDQ